MNLKTIKQLEKNMVTYRQLLKVKSIDLPEDLVPLEPQDRALVAQYQKLQDMIPITGEQILVRQSIKNKLQLAARQINTINKNWQLLVTYGYRSPQIQIKYFWYKLEQIATTQPPQVPSPTSLYEDIHRSVAVPYVAGHPTGGAVDVCLINTNNQLVDCGSTLYDIKNYNRYTFAPIKPLAYKARFTLRQAMMAQGFAPFDGEWWHFSYGDNEWAAYYRKPYALYSQVKTPNTR